MGQEDRTGAAHKARKRESEQSLARYRVGLLSEKCRRCGSKECKEGRR
jgi:hypothetical protein